MSIVLIVWAASFGHALACSNLVVSKGATSDGSTHLAYNSDGQSFYGYMTHLPAKDHEAGAVREIWEFGTGRYMGSIPEPSHTFNVIGNMNEHQVSLGETTFDGVSELAEQEGAVIDYYSLMWITLQRVRTAREAIALMDTLTKEYGYASTGESFSISDPNEAWVMDFIGRGHGEKGAVWVARRVPDGYIGGHANQARIRTFPFDSNDTMYSPDVVEFAKRKGLYPKHGKNEDFSFADVFDPITPVAARSGEARVWDLFRQVAEDTTFENTYLDYAEGKNLDNRMPLFVKVGDRLTLNKTMWLMRSHYEGSALDARNDWGSAPFHSPDRVRPLGFKVRGKQYMLNRNVGYMGTFFHFVAHARGTVAGPTCAGGVIWFGVDDASLSVNAPMYACTRNAPETWAYGYGSTAKYEHRAAFWAFNVVANFAYSRWNLVGAEVQERVVAKERQLFSEVATTDAEARRLSERTPDAAMEFVSNYSIATANSIVDSWVALFPELFVKYRDFLVAAPAPPPAHPKDQPPPPDCAAVGYGPEWYEALVDATGDRYLVPSGRDADEEHTQRKLRLLERTAGGSGPRVTNILYA